LTFSWFGALGSGATLRHGYPSPALASRWIPLDPVRSTIRGNFSLENFPSLAKFSSEWFPNKVVQFF
jgi:hypothetical protein